MKNTFQNSLTMIVLGALAAPLFFSVSAHAIPAFTRAHKVECTTCHTIFPELNEYGEAFLKNSYVYVGNKKAVKEKEVTPVAKPSAPLSAVPKNKVIRGDGDADKLSKLKAGAMITSDGDSADNTATAAAVPTASFSDTSSGEGKSEGILLSAIPEQLPISFTGALNVIYDNKAVNEFDFSTRSFKLHAGGNFRDTIGFFATYVAYSEQPPVGTYNSSVISSNNKTDINEFFITWRHLFDTPVNLKIGRLQPKLGLWKTNNKLSVTNNYLPYTYTVGQQSVFRVEQTQDALELNAVLGKRFFVAGGVVNRKGQNTKEGYGHLSYKFGGADYLANEPEIDLSKDESILDFLTLSVGTYGYYGKNGTANSNDPKNNYYRLGVDTELLYKVFRLRMLGGYGGDDNVAPNIITSKTKVISKSASIEGEYALKMNLLASGRFEYLQQESKPLNLNFNNLYARRYVAALGYSPLENLKLVLEYKYEIANSSINRLGTMGLTFGF